jgi:hypothetical protein
MARSATTSLNVRRIERQTAEAIHKLAKQMDGDKVS